MPRGHPDSYTKCQIDGCERTAASFGFCQWHYVALVVRFRELEKTPKNTVTAGLMEEVMDRTVDPESLKTSEHDNLMMVREAVDKAHLTYREKAILYARYGIGEQEQSLLKVGRRFKVSRERVRQIEAKALYELRRWVNLELKLAGYEGLDCGDSAD